MLCAAIAVWTVRERNGEGLPVGATRL